jgi:hypothetical protein
MDKGKIYTLAFLEVNWKILLKALKMVLEKQFNKSLERNI